MRSPDSVAADRLRGRPGPAPPDLVDGLDCVIESHLPVTVISLHGRLDPATATQVRGSLRKCLAEQPAAIVVDLADVTVGEDTALNVFRVVAKDAVTWPGCPVALSVSTPSIVDGLHRSGIGHYLPIYPDRALALAAAERQPVPKRYSRHLYPTPLATRLARRMVMDACQAWGLTELVESAEVIVTELVSNVVVHAGTDMLALVALREPLLHVSVRDYSQKLPRRLLPDPETGEGGRGLILVEAMATRWGVAATRDCKVVWATLRTRTDGRVGR